MIYRGLETEKCRKIPSRNIIQYVKSMNWVNVHSIPSKVSVYRDPESEYEDIVVPLNMEYDDYGQRISDIIHVIATVENRPISYILDDLFTFPADIIRFRIDRPEMKYSSVSIKDGINLLKGSEKILRAATFDKLFPETYHKYLSRSEVETFINKCQFGQTERGSYIISLICPLEISESESRNNYQERLMIPEEEPRSIIEEDGLFTRQITKRIMEASQYLLNAINEDKIDRIINPEPQKGDLIISANFCEGLSMLQSEDESSTISVQATWSPTIKAPEMPKMIRIHESHFNAIRDIYEKLRLRGGPEKSTFIGKVANLMGTQGEDGKIQGEIVLRFLWEDDSLRARLDLGHDDHITAIKAYEVGDYVSVRGELHWGKRMHTIKNYEQFQIIYEELPQKTILNC